MEFARPALKKGVKRPNSLATWLVQSAVTGPGLKRLEVSPVGRATVATEPKFSAGFFSTKLIWPKIFPKPALLVVAPVDVVPWTKRMGTPKSAEKCLLKM